MEILRACESPSFQIGPAKAVAAPRSDLEAVLAREELEQAGIYVLLGVDPDTGKPTAYIGEGEDVGKRLRQQGEKEFWVQRLSSSAKMRI